MINELPSLLEEGKLSLEEIRSGVSSATVSASQTNVELEVFLDITTLEGESYRICLTRQGYRVVGKVGDGSACEGIVNGGAADNRANWGPYETLPALMNELSPLFRSSFGNSLIQRLMELQNR